MIKGQKRTLANETRGKACSQKHNAENSVL